jgi:hypothetical protein
MATYKGTWKYILDIPKTIWKVISDAKPKEVKG